jgi:hypothetical protein
MLMAAVDQRHVTHDLVIESCAFALNIVGRSSQALEDYFYSSQAKQLDNLGSFALETGRTGTPLLQAALASLDCRLVSSYTAGDHTLFVGNMVDVRVRATGVPLTSHDLSYVYLGGNALLTRRVDGPLYHLIHQSNTPCGRAMAPQGEKREPHACKEADTRAIRAMALSPYFHRGGTRQDNSMTRWCSMFF